MTAMAIFCILLFATGCLVSYLRIHNAIKIKKGQKDSLIPGIEKLSGEAKDKYIEQLRVLEYRYSLWLYGTLIILYLFLCVNMFIGMVPTWLFRLEMINSGVMILGLVYYYYVRHRIWKTIRREFSV